MNDPCAACAAALTPFALEAACAGAPSMSGSQGIAASGGITSGLAASEGNYSGQMEYMGGLLGLLSAGLSGLSTAMQAFGGLGNFGQSLGEALGSIFQAKNMQEGTKEAANMLKGDYSGYKSKYGDSDNGFNRYYNPTSKYYIGNRR